ncbi:hypothetical protein HFP57_04615 [Parasphingopyxis algicola]|uniref:hypothetical protein n=1 Tax=Parasphingopyxis algicola TaxID=2026624 RepID=UPI00159FA1B2|nr:hypothetical protein [Parasphingopyxis algicola]QLC24380.1 hypothetical protein HFP57_04615 [Parasphingopyxis algicola]
MSLFKREPKTVEIDGLYGQYANVLERGPKAGGTIFHINELPASKRLLKAVLLQRAYEEGEVSENAMGVGFVHLGAFQEETNELTGQKNVSAEMEALLIEWKERVRFPVSETNA